MCKEDIHAFVRVSIYLFIRLYL